MPLIFLCSPFEVVLREVQFQIFMMLSRYLHFQNQVLHHIHLQKEFSYFLQIQFHFYKCMQVCTYHILFLIRSICILLDIQTSYISNWKIYNALFVSQLCTNLILFSQMSIFLVSRPIFPIVYLFFSLLIFYFIVLYIFFEYVYINRVLFSLSSTCILLEI